MIIIFKAILLSSYSVFLQIIIYCKGWWQKNKQTLKTYCEPVCAYQDTVIPLGTLTIYSVFSHVFYRSVLGDVSADFLFFCLDGGHHALEYCPVKFFQIFLIRNFSWYSVLAVQPPSYTLVFKIPQNFSKISPLVVERWEDLYLLAQNYCLVMEQVNCVLCIMC